ncbi:hypothetical protein SmJEL517_g05021 [Synchytrium microbalum]|uniref:Succinate dehydrogenase assembly factor 4, mitochondrial n=1 Tax=Synchytrium microbalum TaxID=1806994 RepID=A0A507BWA0_9FUNG|nr:uncharacterized protein SmJEL517_g05021 [Synchytrium microbalum]TPX31742.1 hypothetical protein SmJEL517_g05021 [Synchytrium microbalum]
MKLPKRILYTPLSHRSLLFSSTSTSFNNNQFQRPGPPPLGDAKQQKEMEELLKNAAKQAEADSKMGKAHPDAPSKVASDIEWTGDKNPITGEVGGWIGDKNPITGEIGGPRGREPTRYGDWERKGRVFDF